MLDLMFKELSSSFSKVIMLFDACTSNAQASALIHLLKSIFVLCASTCGCLIHCICSLWCVGIAQLLNLLSMMINDGEHFQVHIVHL